MGKGDGKACVVPVVLGCDCHSVQRALIARTLEKAYPGVAATHGVVGDSLLRDNGRMINT